jgi:AcrR family transcriptional regulator
MGRPPKFSRDQLQAAALQIVDEQGLAALTMRSLAARLGTGPMTLYNHVADRADLDLLVVEAVMAEVTLPRRRGGWRSRLEAIATELWRVMRAHPSAVPLILTRRSRSAAVLDVAEALLDALARGGFAGRELLLAFRSVTAFLAGFAQVELAGPLATAAGEAAADAIARVQSLTADRYPHLQEIAARALESDPESEFKESLHRFVAGLAPGRPR